MPTPFRPTAAELNLPDHVRCPFCEHEETELHSAFGPQLSVATYWCRRCHTAFDWIKRQLPSS
jgi:ring-1,2-phenylacetyl-CoA epoxidase subunit PaaD